MLLIYQGFENRVRSYREVADLFNATYPNRNPISTVKKTVTRFFETRTVKDRPAAEGQNPQQMIITV